MIGFFFPVLLKSTQSSESVENLTSKMDKQLALNFIPARTLEPHTFFSAQKKMKREDENTHVALHAQS